MAQPPPKKLCLFGVTWGMLMKFGWGLKNLQAIPWYHPCQVSWASIFRKTSALPQSPPFRPHLVLAHPQPSIVTYAACCQLDSEDRPLAGTIVFCAHLTSPSLSHSDMVMVTAA